MTPGRRGSGTFAFRMTLLVLLVAALVSTVGLTGAGAQGGGTEPPAPDATTVEPSSNPVASSSVSQRISRCTWRGETPAFASCPICGIVLRRGLISPKASCTAL